MVRKDIVENDESFIKPGADEEEETAEATKKALEKIVDLKLAAAKPVSHAEKQAPDKYIRYTPSQQAASFNS
eukprot:Awhi_evm1s8433